MASFYGSAGGQRPPPQRADIYGDSTLIRSLCAVIADVHVFSLEASKPGAFVGPGHLRFSGSPPNTHHPHSAEEPPPGFSVAVLVSRLEPNLFLSMRTLILLKLLPESTCGKRLLRRCGGQMEEEHVKSDLQTQVQIFPHCSFFRQVQGRNRAGPGLWCRLKNFQLGV